MAAPLQYNPTALLARLSAARARGWAMAGCATRTSFAGHPNVGAKDSHALTFKSDHLQGAGQSNEQPYLDGFYGVLFAYHYAKYGLAPVGLVSTVPSVVDKSNIEKISVVFDKYPNVIGSK